MSYFTFAPLIRGTAARAEQVNAIFTAIVNAFVKLPDEFRLKEGRVTYATAALTSANVYTLALPAAPAGYVEGLEVVFKALETNSGSVTVNVNGLGAKPITTYDGALVQASGIAVGSIVQLRYDGANFQVVSSQNADSTGAVGFAEIARRWAILLDGPVDAGEFSAKHHAQAAAASASTALSSSSSAGTSATNAAASAAAAAGSVGSLLVVGQVVAYAGSAEPTRWKFLNGQLLNRTTHSALFALFGTTYGIGDGVNTFALPNLSGRVVLGAGTGTDVRAETLGFVLGQTSGEFNHPLTAAENGPHTHTWSNTHGHTTQTSGNHVHTGSTDTSGIHSHEYDTRTEALDGNEGGGPTWTGVSTGTTPVGGAHAHSYTTNASGIHSHVVDNTAISGTTSSAGSGTAHNNLQPYLALNYMIYTGVA